MAKSAAKSPNPQKEILKAAKSGDADRVKTLVKQDASLMSARDTDGSTPLHCACWKGHDSVVAVLLEAGADVNAENSNDHWGTTPLHAAAHAGQKKIAELLIAHGANINARNLNKRTPLDETSFHDAKAVAKLLIASGASQ
jgi:ankyrin repeat protein